MVKWGQGTYGSDGRVHKFNHRDTWVTLPLVSELYRLSSTIGTSRAGDTVEFAQVRGVVYPCVASVEFTKTPEKG